jgi:hypothetical protein
MRALTGFLCLSASLLAAPAFADPQQVPAQPDARVSSGTLSETRPAAQAPITPANSGASGWIDRLQVNRTAERPVLPLAPIESDQLNLSVNTGTNWGLTFGITNREENDLLPREELRAGAFVQVSPNFRLGGGVTLNGQSLRSAAEGWRDSRSAREAEAGVRIESAFSF